MLASSLFIFTSIGFSGFGIAVWGLLSVLSIVLSVNLKWVAYLNFKQKWKSILLIILIAIYIVYFFTILKNFGDSDGFKPVHDVRYIITAISLSIFILLYCVFSVLVILFNLPTSSVFEQKLVEVINFQKLSQSRNAGQNEDQVFEILLDSTVSVAVANAAWLDIINENNKLTRTLYFKTSKLEKEEILKNIPSKKKKYFS